MSTINRHPQADLTAASRLTAIQQQLGRDLSAEEQAQVLARLRRSMELAQKLRVTALTNADEPEIVFQPYRSQSRQS